MNGWRRSSPTEMRAHRFVRQHTMHEDTKRLLHMLGWACSTIFLGATAFRLLWPDLVPHMFSPAWTVMLVLNVPCFIWLVIYAARQRRKRSDSTEDQIEP